MQVHGSATTFHVADLTRALTFYTEVLGFTERFRFGDYAGVEYQTVQIHLSGPGSSNKRQVGQGGIYIFCDGVDEYYEQVAARGAAIQAPPQDYEYGLRDFVVEDPDANLVTFGQPSSST
jgi:predicted enzyme related to lactoylglutathione lyase